MMRKDILWLDKETAEPEETEETDERTEERVPPGRKKRIALIVLIVLIVACTGAFFLSDAFAGLIRGGNPDTLITSAEPIEYESDGVTSIRAFQNLCLRIGRNGVQAIDVSGQTAWDVPFSMAGPSLSQAGDYAVIADLKGNQIYILNRDGLVGTIAAENTLTYCAVNKNGDVAVIAGEDKEYILLIYDVKGNVRVRRTTYREEDGIPVALAINDDASRMATSYIDYSKKELQSVVTLFNLTDPNVESADRIAGNYTFPGSLITDLRYMDNMLIYIGDNRIGGIVASGNTSVGWKEELSYRIQSCGFGNDFLAVLYGDGLAGVSDELENNLQIYDKNGAVVSAVKVSVPDSMTVSENLIIYQEGLSYTAIRPDGSPRWIYTSDSTLKHLYALGKKNAVAVTGSSITLMQTASPRETEESHE